jgi:hypothetical protein
MASNGPNAAPGAPVLRAAVQEPAQQSPAAPQANPAGQAQEAGAQNQALDAGASPALDPGRQRQQKLDNDKLWYEKWKKKFAKSFGDGWDLKNVDHQKDKKFVWEKRDSNLKVTIEISEAEDESKIVSFSGTAHHEIADAAKKYSEKMKAYDKTIKFTVEAANDDDAVNFMKGLMNEQFDLDLIKDLTINNTNKGIDYTTQLVARAKQAVELEKQAAAAAPRAGGPAN